MSRYKTDILHTKKCAYRILSNPLAKRVEALAKENGLSPGTQFNFLVRDQLAITDINDYEPTEKAMLYFPNLIVKLERKQFTLYLSDAENEKLTQIAQNNALDKSKTVTSLLVDALLKINAL